MKRIAFSPQAERDLEDIGDYIARDNPRQAIRFVTGLRSQCAKILRAPRAYRLCPELAPEMRSCAVGNYVIFFLESVSGINIIRILHGAMDIEARFEAGFKDQPADSE